MTAYYNEIDPKAAAWLRELIKQGHIAKGEVDERSILDVRPDDLRGFTQCHFFAGIGVWSYALRRAGWGDERAVWTGSCLCQPFSAAGKGGGFDDERHLWPYWQYLIEQCRPTVVFGEQVASKDADAWIDLVQDDLEGMDYTFGAVPFPAAGVGSPNIRDRNYWVAHTNSAQHNGGGGAGAGRRFESSNRPISCGMAVPDDPKRRPDSAGGYDSNGDQAQWGKGASYPLAGGEYGRMGDSQRTGLEGLAGHGNGGQEPGRIDSESSRSAPAASSTGGMAYTECDEQRQRRGARSEGAARDESRTEPSGRSVIGAELCREVNGFWGDADWLLCRDGKWRPVEPGTFPLAHGVAARVVRLRGYGNAINAEAATAFIESTKGIIL